MKFNSKVPRAKKWYLQDACFVQNPKIFHLQLYKKENQWNHTFKEQVFGNS